MIVLSSMDIVTAFYYLAVPMGCDQVVINQCPIAKRYAFSFTLTITVFAPRSPYLVSGIRFPMRVLPCFHSPQTVSLNSSTFYLCLYLEHNPARQLVTLDIIMAPPKHAAKDKAPKAKSAKASKTDDVANSKDAARPKEPSRATGPRLASTKPAAGPKGSRQPAAPHKPP